MQAFDPEGMEQARPLLPDGVRYCRDAMDAATGADVLVVVTEWNEFRALSPERLKAAMRGNVVVDLRNVYDPAAMIAAGFAITGSARRGAAPDAARGFAPGPLTWNARLPAISWVGIAGGRP